MAKSKTNKKTVNSSKTVKYDPHESPIIQAGIVLIIVSAIGITAYVVAMFYR